MVRVRAAGRVSRRAWRATAASAARVGASQSASRLRVLARMRAGTSRRGGVWARAALIFRWAATDGAWFGGSE